MMEKEPGSRNERPGFGMYPNGKGKAGSVDVVVENRMSGDGPSPARGKEEQVMQEMKETAKVDERRNGDRRRVETVIATLATVRGRGESLDEVAHDARNMVTALGLYCDLLEEPGVLAGPFAHYGSELRLVAAASRRLVEKLVALDCRPGNGVTFPAIESKGRSEGCAIAPSRRDDTEWNRSWEPLPAAPIVNLAEELLANRNLLAALAGPAIAVTVDADGGARPVRLSGEDLTRVLVNLVKNAAEAMPEGGRVQISLCEHAAEGGTAGWLALAIEDNGPGIPAEALEKVFETGYTASGRNGSSTSGWLATRRGLGLAICRSIVEAAGGRICAAQRPQGHGARFEIELPVRNVGI
jgi:signal transduction histidine kinase